MQRCKECDKTYLEMPNLSGYFPEWAVPPSRWEDMKLGDSQSASGSPSPERGPRSLYLSQLFFREQISLCHRLSVEGKSWAPSPPPPDTWVSDLFCLHAPFNLRVHHPTRRLLITQDRCSKSCPPQRWAGCSPSPLQNVLPNALNALSVHAQQVSSSPRAQLSPQVELNT